MAKHLILGSGYTGKRLALVLKHLGHDFVETSRSQSAQLSVDLTDPDTWKCNSWNFDTCFWLAPTAAPELTLSFISKCKNSFNKIIVLSSTGFFKHSTPDEIITKDSSLELKHLRVQSEEILLRETKAMILHAAGIYGPNRNPVEWLKSGRVTRSSKYLNAVHVEDLANLLYLFSQNFIPGTRWVASDNHPYRWNDLYEHWKSEYRLENIPYIDQTSESKKVDSSKTFEIFNWRLKYPNVIHGVQFGVNN